MPRMRRVIVLGENRSGSVGGGQEILFRETCDRHNLFQMRISHFQVTHYDQRRASGFLKRLYCKNDRRLGRQLLQRKIMRGRRNTLAGLLLERKKSFQMRATSSRSNIAFCVLLSDSEIDFHFEKVCWSVG